MTTSPTTITLRREPLARALGRLAPMDAFVLLHLALTAHPATGRVWATLHRLAEDLAIPSGIVEHAVTRLAEQKLVEVQSPRHGRLGCIDLDPVLVRSDDVPANLPVEGTL